jgi:hypothetical protein
LKVSNPLTIISIFAGLAEIMATTALIKLPQEMQSIFIYFVMGFPTLIVLSFFMILVFNNKVLYAPGDFSNQEHYMEINDIKRSIEQDLSNAIEELDDSSTHEKEKFMSVVVKTLNNTSDSTKKKKLLKQLQVAPSNVFELQKTTGIHSTVSSLILLSMEDDEIVKRERVGGSDRWSLNA